MTEPFECIKCGCCCKNLIVPVGRFHIGLSLFAEEQGLFPKEMISPYWAIGKNKPKEVVMLQLNAKDCPHLKNNTCSIYEKRPLSCHCFPLTLEIVKQQVISSSLSQTCPVAKPLIHTSTPLNIFPDDILRSCWMRSVIMNKGLPKKYNRNLFMFDLKTQTWSKFTIDDAIAIQESSFH